VASLQGVAPETKVTERPQRPANFWWASSLTGLAAALIVIAVINATAPGTDATRETVDTMPVAVATSPIIDWKTESAMLTRPLQQELEDLQADLKKAEEKVKQEIGL
jgi:hypothetical protein